MKIAVFWVVVPLFTGWKNITLLHEDGGHMILKNVWNDPSGCMASGSRRHLNVH
jgi:hypothetical protein